MKVNGCVSWKTPQLNILIDKEKTNMNNNDIDFDFGRSIGATHYTLADDEHYFAWHSDDFKQIYCPEGNGYWESNPYPISSLCRALSIPLKVSHTKTEMVLVSPETHSVWDLKTLFEQELLFKQDTRRDGLYLHYTDEHLMLQDFLDGKVYIQQEVEMSEKDMFMDIKVDMDYEKWFWILDDAKNRLDTKNVLGRMIYEYKEKLYDTGKVKVV